MWAIHPGSASDPGTPTMEASILERIPTLDARLVWGILLLVACSLVAASWVPFDCIPVAFLPLAITTAD